MQRIRPMLASVAALVVAMAVLGPAVLAQDRERNPRQGHPLLGSWIVDPTPLIAEDAPDLISFHLEGSVRGAGPNGASVGAWEPTGRRSADVTGLYFIDDPEGNFAGFATVRVSLEVAEDGESFTGTYTFEPPAGFGAAFGLPDGELGPAEVTGQRIVAEPMGQPVAPIPDILLEGPPSPGASPAVAASPAAETSPAAEASPPAAGVSPIPETSPAS